MKDFQWQQIQHKMIVQQDKEINPNKKKQKKVDADILVSNQIR
jgi:hypothetical protein